MSPALLDEYRAALLRPKIQALHGLAAGEIDSLLEAIVQHAIWREAPRPARKAPAPGDNHLWALLEAEPTARLVTGDTRLLDSSDFGPRVIRVQDYAFDKR